MLALDLVHAGLAAQAVRDGGNLAVQLRDGGGDRMPALISAFRDLSQTFELFDQLQEANVRARLIAVVLRSQRDTAERQAREHGWAGVAVRPVNAEELVALAVANETTARAPSGGSSRDGELENLRLLDVLAGLIDRIPRPGGGKNVVLELTSHGRVGRVAVVDGELIHAECDGEFGRHVLERLACWRSGSWHVEPKTWQAAPTLSGSSIGLLAVAQEYDRRIDEARKNLPYTDCRCTVRWERVRPLPVVAEAMFRRIAAGVVLAEAIPGEGDDELEAYAALENRIKRGAVVPQIESASGASPSDMLPSASALTPNPAVEVPGPAAMRSTITLPDQVAVGDGRAHPRTHVYRAEEPENGQARVSDMPPALPLTDTPPALPTRPDGASLSSASHMPTGVLRTSNAAVHDTSRYDPVENAARRGAVTGWFGVAMAETDDGGGGDAPLRTSARAESGQLAAFRSTPRNATPRSTPQTGAPRLSARPYAWSGDGEASPAAEVPDEEEDVKPQKLVKAPRWPWLVAGATALLAVAFALVWPTPAAKSVRHGSGQEYRRAVNLIEAGQYDDAIKRLQGVIQGQDVEAEALLTLGVLEIEARQFQSGRQHLKAYLAHGEARHVERAQKLYDHVFAATNAPVDPATTPRPTTPTGG